MIFDTFLGESEILAKVTYDFSGGRPAKLSGPMEGCCPCEPPEIEIEEVNVFGIDILDILSPAIKELIEEQALEHSISAAIDYSEQKADYDRDQQREAKMEGYV